MPASPSTRLGLIGPSGTDTVATGDDTIRAIIAQLEAVGAAYKVGIAAARVGSDATIQALFYVATDTGVVSVATGSVWLDINPKDAAAGTASLRTLGTGAQQAAPGNHNHDAVYQPLDADLTAIAALATQPYGLSLLTQASASAVRTALAISDAHPFLGDGSDGAATLDGTATVAWATKSGSVYTATRDFYCTNLTVNAGVTLITAGWRGFCTGTLANAGTIHNDGDGGAGGGAGGLAGYFAAGGSGAAGAASGVAASGTAAAAVTNAVGGGGGAGASAGSGNNGGAGATATPPTAAQGGLPRTAVALFLGRNLPSAVSPTAFAGGGGGGGGGGLVTSTQAAGRGGGGGGVVALFCKALNNTGTIRSQGGQGTPGSSATGSGGGGGGGMVGVFYKTLTALGTVTANGGAAGTAGSFPSSAGAAGLVITGAI